MFAALEATLLFFLRHREIQLDQDCALAHEILFETDDTSEKVRVFFLGAEAEYRLHHGPVVPASVEENDLATTRKP